MEFDPTTFALEVLNFLVLLWLLRRFLYRPMKAALAARSSAFERRKRELDEEQAALAARTSEIDARSAELEAQREEAQRALEDELRQQRAERVAALDREIDAEREKARARREQDEARARLRDEREHRRRAATHVAGYLHRLASPAVEAAVVELFLSDLAQQSEAARAALRRDWARPDVASAVDISTAFAVPPELKERVQARVRELAGEPLALSWRVDPALISGICVHLPGHSLEASLRRGMDAFAGAADS
jgi:F-type H+-transporting ATPase subunit b